MYVRSDLGYNRKTKLENTDLEDLWLGLLLPNFKPIIIDTCYKEPKNNKIINYLEATLPNWQHVCETIILGVLNICLFNNFNFKNKYTDILNSCNFSQLIEEPTKRITQKSTILINHVHSNNTEKICQSGVLKSGISDHYIIYCTRKGARGQINKHNTVKTRSLKEYSKERYIECLESLNWSVITSYEEVNLTKEKI